MAWQDQLARQLRRNYEAAVRQIEAEAARQADNPTVWCHIVERECATACAELVLRTICTYCRRMHRREITLSEIAPLLTAGLGLSYSAAKEVCRGLIAAGKIGGSMVYDLDTIFIA